MIIGLSGLIKSGKDECGNILFNNFIKNEEYDRAQSYGLSCMQMHGAMAIFAANLKRILKLL